MFQNLKFNIGFIIIYFAEVINSLSKSAPKKIKGVILNEVKNLL